MLGLDELQRRGRDPLIGQTLGMVTIERWMADGEACTMYNGHHTASKSGLVVHVLKAELALRQGFAKQFLFQARIAQQINHPNIVKVVDVGESQGQAYMATEFVRGEPLAAVVKREGRLDFERATRIVRDVARGLEAAHELELVHGDLRPENIWIDTEGIPKIANFGLARRASSGSGRTQIGELTGAPHFIAPEQVDPGIADAKSDQFSLGLVYHYMLTGQFPYTGVNDADIAKARLKHPPPELPDLPLAGRQLKGRMTAYNREERFSTMRELAAQADRALYGRPQSGGPGQFVTPPPKHENHRETKHERRGLTVLPTMSWVPPAKVGGAAALYAVATALTLAGAAMRSVPREARWGMLAGAAVALIIGVALLLKQRTGVKGAAAGVLGLLGLAMAYQGIGEVATWSDLLAPINGVALGLALVLAATVSSLRFILKGWPRRLVIVGAWTLIAIGAVGTPMPHEWVMAAPTFALPVLLVTMIAAFCGVYLMPHPGVGYGLRFLGVAATLVATAGVALIAAGGNVEALAGDLPLRVVKHGTLALGVIVCAVGAQTVVKSSPNP